VSEADGLADELIWRAGKCGQHFDADCESCQAALSYTNGEMDRLRAALRQPSNEAERLREALRPFARCADTYAPEQPDDRQVIEREPCILVVSLGDLRRARAALNPEGSDHAG
jgi:hypothetical protein